MPVTDHDWSIIDAFQKKYPTKEEKEEALKRMTNDEIDVLIKASPSVFGKIFFSRFKKKDDDDNKA